MSLLLMAYAIIKSYDHVIMSGFGLYTVFTQKTFSPAQFSRIVSRKNVILYKKSISVADPEGVAGSKIG